MRRSFATLSAAATTLLATAYQASATIICPPGFVDNGLGQCVPATEVPEISAVAGVAAVAALAAGVAIVRERMKR